MYRRGTRYFLFLILGFTTLASQIIILRQLMVVFSGNELTLGLALASWMIWAGLANLIIGKYSDRLKRLDLIIPLACLALAVIFPATLVAASLVKPILGIPLGEMVDLATIFMSTLVILAPLCFIDGLLLNILAKTGTTGRSIDIGEVYLFDALGSALGGIVYGWIAIEYLNPLLATLILSAILLISISFISLDGRSRRRPAILPQHTCGSYLNAFILLIVVIAAIFSPNITSRITKINWRGYNPVKIVETKYQNIAVTENRGEYTMFSDGLPLFTIPDKATTETLAHLPLIEVADPKRVLVIGGGISGLASELNKYRLENITCIQIDPMVTNLEADLMGGKIPPDVEIVHEDGRFFLNKFDPNTHRKFDVIILNVGDPQNASTNRYFTSEFFAATKNALEPDGILFFGIYQTANYISDDAIELLTTIFRTLRGTFPAVIVVPLDRYYFMASMRPGILTDNLEELMGRLNERSIATDIFATETLYGTYQGRVDDVKKLIDEQLIKTKRINSDSRPIAYFSGITLWGQKFGLETGRIFQAVSKIKWWWIIIGLSAIGLISLLFTRKLPIIPIFWTLFAAGWTGITIELLILIKYQVEVGMLFYRVGFIITAFMVGLSAGAFLAIQYLKRTPSPQPRKGAWPPRGFTPSPRRGEGVLITLLAVLIIYIPLSLMVVDLSYMLANLIVGLICGAIYQIAAELIIERGVGKTAGLINGADYIGSAAGSLIAATALIPLFGFDITLIICAVIVAIALITVQRGQVWTRDKLKIC